MPLNILFKHLSEIIPLAIAGFILLCSVFFTFKTRFIQFRTIPLMLSILWKSIFAKKSKSDNTQTIAPYKSLFTAMSTVIGIGNMVAPIIAIKLGGPGALLGFLIVTLFAGAVTFIEVTFVVNFRRKNADGSITGGPMPYIEKALSPFFANLYAVAGLTTVIIYNGAQTNILADLLQANGIPSYVTGIIIAIIILYILIGGIKRIGNFSAKIVPLMFLIYCSAGFWIIGNNLSKLPSVINMIFRSAFTPKAIFGAGVGYTILSALRWGLAKGFYTNEAGLGIGTFPHSMTKSNSPTTQGVLAMLSVYSNGLMCIMSGLMVLLTGTWQDPNLGIGINILAKTFSIYFPTIGIFILLICSLLFALGTILGNSYNGSQCLLYVTKRHGIKFYYVAIALVILISSVLEVELVAKIVDFVLIPLAILNLTAIFKLLPTEKGLLKINKEELFK
ncbi:alanine/glycine:cation symporter family protein [Candidatus Dependentiae bacterium]